MPYAPIIPLIMGAGLGPSTTLAHFSEVTQGKVGGRGREDQGREAEIDFICFLSSWCSKCLRTPPSLFPTSPPPINNNPHRPPLPPLLPTSPLYSEGETTDFLPAPSVCFSKRQYTSIYHFSMFCITEALRATFPQPVFLF